MIDANALIKELDKFINPMPDANGLYFLQGLSTAITEIAEAPTVDAVEVVRCKDCKHFGPFAEPYNTAGLCRVIVGIHRENDFCSCGEVRANER